jgi:hypothetical protein
MASAVVEAVPEYVRSFTARYLKECKTEIVRI